MTVEDDKGTKPPASGLIEVESEKPAPLIQQIGCGLYVLYMMLDIIIIIACGVHLSQPLSDDQRSITVLSISTIAASFGLSLIPSLILFCFTFLHQPLKFEGGGICFYVVFGFNTIVSIAFMSLVAQSNLEVMKTSSSLMAIFILTMIRHGAPPAILVSFLLIFGAYHLARWVFIIDPNEVTPKGDDKHDRKVRRLHVTLAVAFFFMIVDVMLLIFSCVQYRTGTYFNTLAPGFCVGGFFLQFWLVAILARYTRRGQLIDCDLVEDKMDSATCYYIFHFINMGVSAALFITLLACRNTDFSSATSSTNSINTANDDHDSQAIISSYNYILFWMLVARFGAPLVILPYVIGKFFYDMSPCGDPYYTNHQ